MLELQNIEEKKQKLNSCDTSEFMDPNSSFLDFVDEIKINSFRHIENLNITFEHPVTVISGANKVGKTSILLLLACSFEKFLKVDSTSPNGEIRDHTWKDVISFTAHETASNDYSYELSWRLGKSKRSGEGKRLATSKAWSGLGKKSSDTSRINAKIREREVRLIDLERVLPGRSFSNALFRKANESTAQRLNQEMEQAFSFIFDVGQIELYEVGSHINKSCFLIKKEDEEDPYSSFNAASGEEAVIYLLKDVLESPKNSLVLIDEIEAGFHPSIQRKVADLIQYISWRDKKQFILTTHSPTLLSALPARSRRFIEKPDGNYKVIKNISHQAAHSKMDSIGHPLIRCYCEDELASFIINKILLKISNERPHFHKLVNIITSGPVNQVKNDYERHKRNFSQYRNRIGYCAIFDGDYKDHPDYSSFFNNSSEDTLFIYPFDAPEKFLVKSYLNIKNNSELRSALEHNDHHSLFQQMKNLGLAVDYPDARAQCYLAFEQSPEYAKHSEDLSEFLIKTVSKFSKMTE